MVIDCFKYYTVFHLVPPICSGALLFYLFKLEGRLEPVFIMIIITGTQQVFMYCLFGNVLNYEVTIGECHPWTIILLQIPFQSKEFPDHIYNTQWYNLEQREKTAVLILLTGAQKEIFFKAGDVYEMNLPLFVSVSNAVSFPAYPLIIKNVS